MSFRINRLFGKRQMPDVKVDGVIGWPGHHRVTIEVAVDEPINPGAV